MGQGLTGLQPAVISARWTFKKKVAFEVALDIKGGINFANYNLVDSGDNLNIVNSSNGLIMGYFDSNGDLYMSGDVHTSEGSLKVATKAISEGDFRLASQEAKKRRGGSGFDSFGIISGGNINIGLKASTLFLSIAESSVSVNGHSVKIPEQAFSMADAANDENARQDFVGLEVWEELVSDKDFVYPLGNTQSASTSINSIGTVSGSFTGFGTYSLFGNWQSSSDVVGKGVVWSTLTVDEKMTVISDPENNIFLNEDGDYVQVRYRIRVVQGLTSNGAEWDDKLHKGNLSDILDYDGLALQCLKPKGNKTSISLDLDIHSNGAYLSVGHQNNNNENLKQIGIYSAFASSSIGNYDTAIAYKGNCFMLPIAMVSRNRNQGGYHAEFNPGGTKKFSDSDFWYGTKGQTMTSTADCFVGANLLTASGDIASGVSGRPDGFYYDEINELDVHDLRLPTNYEGSVDTELARHIKAEARGYEAEFSLTHIGDVTATLDAKATTANQGGTGVKLTFTGEDITGTSSNFGTATTLDNDFKAFVKNDAGVYRQVTLVLQSGGNTILYTHPRYGDITAEFTLTNSFAVIISELSDRFQNNTQQRCEIIGDPANYSFSSHVGVANLIDVNDGSDQLPDAAATVFRIAGKSVGALTSIIKNNALQTLTTHYTFSTTTNEITFVSAPLVADVIEVFYDGFSDVLVPSVNEEIYERSFSDVFFSNYISFDRGSLILNNLLSKVATYTGSSVSDRLKITRYTIEDSTEKFVSTSTHFIKTTEDNGLALSAFESVKFFLYQTDVDGLLYNVLVFKEMIFDVDWGDDDKFDITNNIVTKTDDNGNTIIYGTVISQNPVGFAKD